MEVGEKDLLQVGEPHCRALELPLGALGAVEQEPLAAAAEQEGRRCTLRRRHRGRRAEEEEVEVHAGPV